jgi:hypothetical protein
MMSQVSVITVRTVMCEEFDVHDAWLSDVRDGVDITVSLMK